MNPRRSGPCPRRYQNVVDENGVCAIPRTECMKDVSRRVVGYWEEEIVPAVRSGKRVLVAVSRCGSTFLYEYAIMLIYQKVQGPVGWSN